MNRCRTRVALVMLTVVASGIPSRAPADGPADNHPEKVRRVPRLGVEIPAETRAELLKRVDRLENRLLHVLTASRGKAEPYAADVEIFARAVREAVEYQEFFDQRDIKIAREVLDEGEQRVLHLEQGRVPWTEAAGLVVRGHRSRLDGTVQPLGLIVPGNYAHSGPPRRLDVWFHGRGETVSEMRFIHQRMRNGGVFQPQDAIVLHPYGRYSNAFKFAGEVDTLETIEFVKQRYRIDADRIAVRGFSMGGAGCWQFAVHYPSRWFAANPGAGFSETPEFLRFFQKEKLAPRWWERDLWHWYDCTDWSPNLQQCPTVAYSGELDIQKQAADIMAQSLKSHGMKLTHIIGSETKHRYHPQARDEVERRMTELAQFGRQIPHKLRLVTYTLKYNRMFWLQVDGLQEHWRRSEVQAEVQSPTRIAVRTSNVTALSLRTPSGWTALANAEPITLEIDGDRLELGSAESDRSLNVSAHRVDGQWRIGLPAANGLRKRAGLQGPIDDALMDSFIFVEPSGKAMSPQVDEWTRSELARAKEHWRRHFRGHARTVSDQKLTDEMIAEHNLILWGDPSSNAVLRRIADRLPIRWGKERIQAGEESFSSDQHALLMVYPNPLNPERYVVLNSSFTFRDYAYLNNARQTAKLPDWAVVRMSEQADPAWPKSRWPGAVVGANFFDENWGLREPRSVDDAPDSF